MNLIHSSKPANTVYSPPKGFFRKYKSNLKANIWIPLEQQTLFLFVLLWRIEKNNKDDDDSHGSFVVLAGFPVSVGHGELVEIREQRRDHWIDGAVEHLRILAVRFRRHGSLSKLALCFGALAAPGLVYIRQGK